MAPYDPRVLLDRSYFQLQAEFAARVAAIEALSMGEAFRLHTAFYALARDNDAGVAPERNDFDPAHPAWTAFLHAVENGVDPVSYVYEDYLSGDAQEDDETTCFGFTYWPEDQLVRVHFSNDPDGTALRASSVDKRREELRTIFETIADAHPDAATVRGTSWLYHLEAYRRLFPPAFVGTLASVGYPHQFAALWAQFIDRHGVVKPRLASAFVAAIQQASDSAQLDAAFPLDVLAAESKIALFYDHFGVGRS